MLIKDQIRSRREALGLDMLQLAKRVGVTEQAVRHWESGRSYPGKSKMRLVEAALSFVLDWTEGVQPPGGSKTAAAMVDQSDMNLLLVICKLPLRAKNALAEFAEMHLEALEQGRQAGARQSQPPPKTVEAKPAPRKKVAVTAGRR